MELFLLGFKSYEYGAILSKKCGGVRVVEGVRVPLKPSSPLFTPIRRRPTEEMETRHIETYIRAELATDMGRQKEEARHK